MNKGLESWKYLCSNGFVDIPIPKGNETDEDLDDYAIGCGFTIEKELKRLEWYDNLGKPTSGILPKKQDYRLNQLLNCFEYIDQENIRSLCQKRYEEIVDIIDENETNKKALEIIKKTPLSFRIKIIEQANDLDGSVDLLKEVLYEKES